MKALSHVIPIVVLVAALAFMARRRGQRRQGQGSTVRRRAGATDRQPLLGITGIVAGREVRQRMHGRAFRVATAIVLVGVAAAIVVPTLTRGHNRTYHVGVVGSLSTTERAAVLAAGHSLNTKVELLDEPDQATADAALRGGDLDVVVVDASGVVVHKAIGSGDTSTTAQLARAVSAVVGTAQAISAAHLTPAQAAAIADARALPVRSLQPATTNGTERETGIIGLVVIFVMLTQYLTWTLTGVMEEKANRVVEVLLAAVRPVQLLAGKLLGIGIVVFAQAALIAAFALVLGKAVGSDLLHGAAPMTVLGFLAWLVLGYAFYSWLYAAAGSMAERQDQVQSLAIPLMLPMLLSYVVGFTTIGGGHATVLSQVLAYLPPTAPFAMPVLVALHAVSWWQFTASALITIACTAGVARLAATVYRRAILRTGGRVRLRELRSVGKGQQHVV